MLINQWDRYMMPHLSRLLLFRSHKSRVLRFGGRDETHGSPLGTTFSSGSKWSWFSWMYLVSGCTWYLRSRLSNPSEVNSASKSSDILWNDPAISSTTLRLRQYGSQLCHAAEICADQGTQECSKAMIMAHTCQWKWFLFLLSMIYHELREMTRSGLLWCTMVDDG